MTLTTETPASALAAVVRKLPVAAIAEHPDNPRRELQEIDELAASLQAHGLIQPIVVVPVEAFMEGRQASGGVRIQPSPGTTHVVVAGHRRCAAAELAGWGEIDAIVRPDLASGIRATVTFVTENLQRVDLNPLEEAAGFALLVDEGLSQREIARECGFSQPHVSKRLALLRLPQGAQDALATSKITAADASKLLALPADAQSKAWDLVDNGHCEDDVEWAVDIVESELKQAEGLAKAHEQAAAEQVELVDPQKAFGTYSYKHRIYDKPDIAKARKAGTLRAAASPHGLTYYTTTAPPEPSYETDRKNKEKQVKQASKNRGPALARLVAKPPMMKQLLAELADAVVHGDVGHADAVRLVRSWLPADRFPQPVSKEGSFTADYYTWRDSIPEADWPWVAWAMVVASTELATRPSYTNWGPRQAAHVQRLVDQVGYEPTPWETQQLEEIAAREADSAAASDNGGITDPADATSETEEAGR
jgi:ParB family chromosome partitioning protein